MPVSMYSAHYHCCTLLLSTVVLRGYQASAVSQDHTVTYACSSRREPELRLRHVLHTLVGTRVPERMYFLLH